MQLSFSNKTLLTIAGFPSIHAAKKICKLKTAKEYYEQAGHHVKQMRAVIHEIPSVELKPIQSAPEPMPESVLSVSAALVLETHNCCACSKALDYDHVGGLVGIFENETYLCYGCYYSVEDAKQVIADDARATAEGYRKNRNGDWVKRKPRSKKTVSKSSEA